MMPTRGLGDGHTRPEVGDTLLVVHDFQARSSDELSLTKGDRVELIERDDEFGDGWFLGRHLVNGNTGLFPEVYTRVSAKPAPGAPSMPGFVPSKPLATLPEITQEPPLTDLIEPSPISEEDATPEPPQAAMLPTIDEPSPTLPLNSVKTDATATPTSISSGSPATALGRLNNESQDSQVLNDTLNVINEHITDLRSPASNGALHAPTNDSGSEYSAPLDSRMSYIQGEETDEEEGGVHSRAEVQAWTPDDVAEYLFTNGVESHHCEVFRDQEISGEVLLGMDQSSLFIKDFDLGSVGRRLKTWHKIKTLQDDVADHGLATRRTTQTYGSEVGSDEVMRTRSRNNTNSISNRPISVSTRRLSMTQTPKASPTTLTSPVSPRDTSDSPILMGHARRPSAASVRELHHSRRHSSNDFRNAGPAANATTPKLSSNGTFPLTDGTAHKKQPSFDRNWTLGIAQRPLSSTGLHDIMAGGEADNQDSAVDLDRGYFSGTEADGRKRNVLRKRDSTSHSRKSSYAEEQRVRSATALSRHSRFGSVDSFREGAAPSAAAKYYGLQPGAHRRTASTNTTESVRPVPPAKDGPSPTVTKLDGESNRQISSPAAITSKHLGFGSEWLSSVVNKKSPGSAVRATSDTLSNKKNPVEPPPKDQPLPSPAPTGSSTPSAGPSFELESPDLAKSPGATMTSAPKSARRKGKKETSAYTQGLLNIAPKEAMAEAEYSGWMRKKSSNLMTTWKPRLFVLKGRRLAYYYSETDTQEKGLIDISFHRVLPADNDRLTGLHATISGVVSHPTNLLPGSGTGDDGEPLEKGDDTMFIFKLVPPRAGLSRAVNFTKPTVHYFAVPNLKQGRLWMAALMKATIDRDDSQPITTSYQQKTISLAKAKQMRHRPPALMNLDEASEDEQTPEAKKDRNGLGIFGEADSGVSGVDKLAGQKVESAKLNADFGEKDSAPPTSA